MTKSVQKHLLLVEDDPIIALATKNSLERFGYAVSTAISANAAINAARSGTPFHLILMDIDLGAGMDGTEVASAILSEQHIPVVFLSSHTDPEVVAKTEKITSYGYVVKNSNVAVLDASIKMALKLFDAYNRLGESEKRFQDLFENMNDAFALHEVVYSAAGKAVDYRFIEVNSEFANRLGLSREQLVGHTARELFPATEKSWIDAIGRVATTGVAEQLTEYSVELDRYFETRLYSPQPGLCAGLFSDVTERRRMENANRASEERLGSLFNRVNDAIFVHALSADGTPGPNVAVNEQASRMLGYSRDELSSMSARDVVPESASAKIAEHGAKLLANKHLTFETENRRQDGTIIPVEVSAYVHTEGGERQVVSIVRDLTARKLAERELRQFRTMTDNAVFGCATADVAGTVRYVNRAFAEVHGYEPDELIGRHISIFHTEEQLQSVAEFNNSLKATGTANITEIGHVHRDGTEFPMLMGGITLNNEQGVPELLVVSAIDIRDRKRFEDALLESEAQYRDLYENAPDAVIIAEIETGRILRANSAATTLTGRAVPELVGTHHNSLHPPTHQAYSEESFTRKAGLPTVMSFASSHLENEVLRADGTTVPVDVTASKVIYEGRRCLMGTFRDIRDRKESEQRIQALVTEKENLLKEVQHRIKNLMRTMGAMLSLQAAAAEEPSAVTALNDAASRFRSIELLYDNLYRSDAHSSGSLAAYLSPLIDGVVSFFGSAQAVKVETTLAEVQLPDKMLSTVGLIVNELITNAMKYAFAQRTTGQLTVRGEVLNENIVITVQDDGPGLPEKFDAQTSGGFGLTMVQAFTEQLRGTVVFQRSGGTTVKVVFPQN